MGAVTSRHAAGTWPAPGRHASLPGRNKGARSRRIVACDGLRFRPVVLQEDKLKTTTRLLKWRRGATAWTPDQAPEALRGLPPSMRRKAIEIANGLLQEGVDEARAIRIATAKARSWALQQQRQPDGD